MSGRDLKLATQDRWPVLLITKNIVAAVLEKSAPPADIELDIRIPGMPLSDDRGQPVRYAGTESARGGG